MEAAGWSARSATAPSHRGGAPRSGPGPGAQAAGRGSATRGSCRRCETCSTARCRPPWTATRPGQQAPGTATGAPRPSTAAPATCPTWTPGPPTPPGEISTSVLDQYCRIHTCGHFLSARKKSRKCEHTWCFLMIFFFKFYLFFFLFAISQQKSCNSNWSGISCCEKNPRKCEQGLWVKTLSHQTRTHLQVTDLYHFHLRIRSWSKEFVTACWLSCTSRSKFPPLFPSQYRAWAFLTAGKSRTSALVTNFTSILTVFRNA